MLNRLRVCGGGVYLQNVKLVSTLSLGFSFSPSPPSSTSPRVGPYLENLLRAELLLHPDLLNALYLFLLGQKERGCVLIESAAVHLNEAANGRISKTLGG